MIRAVIVQAHHRFGHDVYLYETFGEVTYLISQDGVKLQVERNLQTSELQPSVRLGPGELEAIVVAATENVTPDKVMQDSVNDARGTRDRLLTLVEKVVTER